MTVKECLLILYMNRDRNLGSQCRSQYFYFLCNNFAIFIAKFKSKESSMDESKVMYPSTTVESWILSLGNTVEFPYVVLDV